MSPTSTPATGFLDYLESRHVTFDYKIDDFLYGHIGPCPQVARDHPFGQAPEVLNIPPEEWADWQTHVGDYYHKNAEKFGLDAAAFSGEHFLKSGLVGYAPVDDADFGEMLGEGLYSKFLCPTLDPIDQKRFAPFLSESDRYEYFKSDYSCMSVIEKPWPKEYVAPTVVLLRRPRTNSYGCEVVCIALSYWDDAKSSFVELPAPLVPTDGEAWRLAKYFTLQGAIHRINLVDHTEVHFPSDTINAITKTVLPTRNLVFQLLQPHLWLTLPVNNSVLESPRSLINRKTWYPWSPFVARGDEVRKLLPFGWYGSRYYFKEPNSAYPAYRFQLKPYDLPSRYGAFIAAYHAPIRAFVRKVVEQLPADDDTHTDWIEIQSWAEHISAWLPGFPSWSDFLARTPEERSSALETLTDTLAMIILNASVIHAADHTLLHKLMNEKPVPFILRVPPPRTASHTQTDLPDSVMKSVADFFHNGLAPLCLPTDLIYARMADLLFYQPHNASLLIDCDYKFKSVAGPLSKAVSEVQDTLRQVAASQQSASERYGFPFLEPPANSTGDDRASIAQQKCIAAGIQY
jgi:hypothetical protein